MMQYFPKTQHMLELSLLQGTSNKGKLDVLT